MQQRLNNQQPRRRAPAGPGARGSLSSRPLARPSPLRAVAPPAADRAAAQAPAAAAAAAPARVAPPSSPPPAPPAPSARPPPHHTPDAPANQSVREGSHELPLVSLQAGKADPEQTPLAQLLAPLPAGAAVDVAVAGCGPAGLYLAAQLAQRGLSVGLVGPDAPFVNNYGVWLDEFEALGLEHTVERAYADAVCFFGEGEEVRVGRAYGRVGRRALRAHLAGLCAEAGVRYMAGEVESAGVDARTGATTDVVVRPAAAAKTRRAGSPGDNGAAADDAAPSPPSPSPSPPSAPATVPLTARLVVLASGAAAGRLLKYEAGAPRCAAQTAYGVEADVEGYGDAYDGESMLFMDYRRHHTGMWDGGARRLAAARGKKGGGKKAGGGGGGAEAAAAGGLPMSHPNAADGMWDAEGEVPSFLYAMPLDDGGAKSAAAGSSSSSSSSNGSNSSNGSSSSNGSNGSAPAAAAAPTPTTRRVFLEETCLVAKPALPFAVLKRRLQRRLDAMGVRVVRVHEEEWSYIPVGGPLPRGDQPLVAFGAAANLVHPATGFSVSRSLREAPAMADAVAEALGAERAGAEDKGKRESVGRAARRVWGALWPAERRRQAAFHLFGMELLARLDLPATNAFFRTFFALPSKYWRGFLASRLSSGDLVAFAAITFLLAPLGIKARLVSHLLTDPAGRYLAEKYLTRGNGVAVEEEEDGAVAGEVGNDGR